MNETELKLTDLLRDRASHVSVLPPMEETLRRTRRRRVTNVSTALLSLVAVIGVSVAGVQTLVGNSKDDAEILRPTNTAAPYLFESTQGQYPTIAHGEFRGATWELTGTSAGREGAPRVDLKLTITTDAGSVVDELAVEAGDDVLMNRYVTATEQLDGAHVVYGAIQEQVSSAEVDVADRNETVIPVHLFSGHDSRSSIAADYFLAFVPGESLGGRVHARDELGIDLEIETYGRVSPSTNYVASGKTGDAYWNLLFTSLGKDVVCLSFAPTPAGNKCFGRAEIEDADPLLVATFELEERDITALVAMTSDDVGHVRLARDGMEPVTLPWFQPPADRRFPAERPVRLVVVGLPSGTHGALQAYGDEGSGALFKERF